jgi:hypothetical protein
MDLFSPLIQFNAVIQIATHDIGRPTVGYAGNFRHRIALLQRWPDPVRQI